MAHENFVGSKLKKAWSMKPKAKAGRPATGKGEWRAMRKSKAPKQEAPKKKKRGGQDEE